MPMTRYPSRNARMVIARIAGFNPGTSPPPVRIAIVPFPPTMPSPVQDQVRASVQSWMYGRYKASCQRAGFGLLESRTPGVGGWRSSTRPTLEQHDWWTDHKDMRQQDEQTSAGHRRTSWRILRQRQY